MRDERRTSELLPLPPPQPCSAGPPRSTNAASSRAAGLANEAEMRGRRPKPVLARFGYLLRNVGHAAQPAVGSPNSVSLSWNSRSNGMNGPPIEPAGVPKYDTRTDGMITARNRVASTISVLTQEPSSAFRHGCAGRAAATVRVRDWAFAMLEPSSSAAASPAARLVMRIGLVRIVAILSIKYD